MMLVLCLIFLFTSIIVIIIYTYKIKKIIMRLNAMVTDAKNGVFVERNFNESMISALETNLYEFIRQKELTSEDVFKEKETIKTLISDISHQTKTPISNILLYSELLKEQKLPDEANELMNELVDQSQKLNFLVSSLIKTSRLETGIITVKPQEESIKKLIESAVREIRAKANQKSIAIHINENGEVALFDYKWTVEALYNILDNAVKYSNNNTDIDVNVITYELFARINVTDQGMGMKEEELNKIFKRFFRSGEVKDIEGVGIGLYLTNEIVTNQGGYLKVESELGRGSTFSIFLPK